MIDMPNVFKLGKGPEQGHVNCSFFLQENLDPPTLVLSSSWDVFKITGKNVLNVRV
jgi:hypothetical protein